MCGAFVPSACHWKGCDNFMIKVKAGGSEPLEKILKRFKKKCEKEGLIKDIKRSSFYEKPSERRRRKLRKMIKRAQKAEATIGFRR